MTDLPCAWIAAMFMLSGSTVVRYFIVTRELRPWRQYPHALVAERKGRSGASGVIHFERSGRSCQLSLHTNRVGHRASGLPYQPVSQPR
jgi:hypothetical protein